MAEKSIKKNYIFNLCYQLLVLFMPLIITPYISRVLGVEGIGKYSYANSIVSYFLLMAVMGTTSYGQRAIGYTQNDKESRSRCFWEVFYLRIITSSIMLLAYGFIVFCILDNGSRVIYVILALNILNVMIDITWFFQGMEEFAKTVTTSIVFRILYLITIFLFVKKSSDLWIYVLIMSAQAVFANLTLWLMLPKYLCRVNGIKPFRDIKAVLQLFIPTIATQVYVVLDKSMIGWFTDTYFENGCYEQAEKVAKITISVITALGPVMIPRISRCYKEGDLESIKSYIYKSYRFIWFLGVPIMMGLFAIASVFVPLFFGEGYEKCITLIPIFSCLTVFIGLSNVTGMQYFVPTGKQNVLTMTVVIGATINLVLNLILIPIMASIGAAVATVAAEFGIMVAGFAYVKKKGLFDLKPVFLSSWKYWVAGAAMCAAVYAVKSVMPIAVWALAALIVFGAVAYFLILLILRDELLIGSIKAVLFRLKKKPAEVHADENADNN